jgi:hypothetical protein
MIRDSQPGSNRQQRYRETESRASEHTPMMRPEAELFKLSRSHLKCAASLKPSPGKRIPAAHEAPPGFVPPRTFTNRASLKSWMHADCTKNLAHPVRPGQAMDAKSEKLQSP